MYKRLLRSVVAVALSTVVAYGVAGGNTATLAGISDDSGWTSAPVDSGWTLGPLDSGWTNLPEKVVA